MNVIRSHFIGTLLYLGQWNLVLPYVPGLSSFKFMVNQLLSVVDSISYGGDVKTNQILFVTAKSFVSLP